MRLYLKKGMELGYLFETDNLCMVDNKIYFSAKNYDALVSINLENYNARIETNFCNKDEMSYCAHSKIICYKHSIFCIPRYSNCCIKYDLHTKQSFKMELPDIKCNKSMFGEAIQIDNKIVCFPEFYKNIIMIDMISNQMSIIKELKNDEPNSYIFSSNAVKYNEAILIPLYKKNKILKWDYYCSDFSFIDVESNAKGFTSIALLEDKLYLMGTDNILYIINGEGRVLTTSKNLDGILYVIDNLVWLISKVKNEIYKIDYSRLAIERFQVYDEYRDVLKNSIWIKTELIGEFIYIVLQRENLEVGILKFNSKSMYYAPIYIETLLEDLFKNKCIFEEHSKFSIMLFKNVMNNILITENMAGNIGKKIFDEVKGGRLSENSKSKFESGGQD